MTEWIACSQRMPEMSEPTETDVGKSDEVLVFGAWISGNGARVEFIDVMSLERITPEDGTHWYDGDDSYFALDQITHWMPLPSPPRT